MTNSILTGKAQPLYWEILITAHLFFESRGFEQTSISDVCESLNISISQFFSLFDSLDTVLDELWDGNGLDNALRQIVTPNKKIGIST